MTSASAVDLTRSIFQIVQAAATWPVFSRTSNSLVRGIFQQGIRPITVIDVGANKGQFTVAAAEVLGPAVIHCFEPLPEMHARIARATRRYQHRVRLHPFALGDESRTSVLNVNAHSQSSSLRELGERHHDAFPDAIETRSIEIAVKRLDEVLSADDLPRPTLLKIDTQGYESEVIAGAKGCLEHIDWVIAELSFAPLYKGEATFSPVLRQIESEGFIFQRPVGALRNKRTGEYLQMDALFAAAR